MVSTTSTGTRLSWANAKIQHELAARACDSSKPVKAQRCKAKTNSSGSCRGRVPPRLSSSNTVPRLLISRVDLFRSTLRLTWAKRVDKVAKSRKRLTSGFSTKSAPLSQEATLRSGLLDSKAVKQACNLSNPRCQPGQASPL